jgi:hypothetical protein
MAARTPLSRRSSRRRPAPASQRSPTGASPTGGGQLTAEQLGTVHLIGVGGVGMSGLARLLLTRGIPTTGSELRDWPALAGLRALGGTVYMRHEPSNLDGVDTVVYSTAIPADHLELTVARERGLRVLHRSEALAAAMSGRRTIAVAGTHGKTTTTSLVTTILQHAGLDPSFVIGGEISEVGSNAHHGSGEHFVAEADESDRSFLLYRPYVSIVTNVDADNQHVRPDRRRAKPISPRSPSRRPVVAAPTPYPRLPSAGAAGRGTPMARPRTRTCGWARCRYRSPGAVPYARRAAARRGAPPYPAGTRAQQRGRGNCRAAAGLPVETISRRRPFPGHGGASAQGWRTGTGHDEYAYHPTDDRRAGYSRGLRRAGWWSSSSRTGCTAPATWAEIAEAGDRRRGRGPEVFGRAICASPAGVAWP